MPRKKKLVAPTKKSTKKKATSKKAIAKEVVEKKPATKKAASKKKKARKKKRKPHPLEGLVNFEYDGLKSGDEVIYKRLGDGSTSIGIVQYFDKTIGEPCVTVIDLLLGTFHTSLIEYINRDPTKKQVRALWARAESRASSPRRKRV